MSGRSKRKRVRTHRLEVYLSDAELAALQAVSGHSGVSVSECVRRLITNAGVSGHHGVGDQHVNADVSLPGLPRLRDPREPDPSLVALGISVSGYKPNPFSDEWTIAEVEAVLADLRSTHRRRHADHTH